MEKFDKVLKWLSGKKGVIAALLSLTNGYLLEKAIYDNVTFLFIGGIIVILFGATSFATNKMYERLAGK